MRQKSHPRGWLFCWLVLGELEANRGIQLYTPKARPHARVASAEAWVAVGLLLSLANSSAAMYVHLLPGVVAAMPDAGFAAAGGDGFTT